MIVRTQVVSAWSEDKFNRNLMHEIQEMQNEGLKVEIQFSNVFMEERDMTEYNALVIGRKA